MADEKHEKLKHRFLKRRGGISKKARELATLCGAQVAIIIYSSSGELFEISNPCMKTVLDRYKEKTEPAQNVIKEEILEVENKTDSEKTTETASLNGTERAKPIYELKEDIGLLSMRSNRLLGKDECDLDREELQQLELQLSEAMLSIDERKEQILTKQLDQSRIKAQRESLTNETLRKQVEELDGVLPLMGPPKPMALEYFLSPAKEPSTNASGVKNPYSDTTLTLGLPYGTCGKRKEREEESHSEYELTPFEFTPLI